MKYFNLLLPTRQKIIVIMKNSLYIRTTHRLVFPNVTQTYYLSMRYHNKLTQKECLPTFIWYQFYQKDCIYMFSICLETIFKYASNMIIFIYS